jgi:formylglycine-generating enzyme required for sulfatase activity
MMRNVRIGGLVLACLGFVGGMGSTLAAAPSPGGDSWQAAIVAAREALAAEQRPPGDRPAFASFASPTVRDGEPARRIRLDVTGLDDLYLYVTGDPDVVRGAGTWAEARLVAHDGAVTVASHAPGLKVIEGRFSIDVNLKSGVSGPLRIAGRAFRDGLHVYADSKVRIPLNRKYKSFEAWIGIDDWVGGPAGVRFDVCDAAGAARIDQFATVRRDFPDGASRRQMRWEREDRILDADWTPGDVGALARRYAAAARRVPPVAAQAQRLAVDACDPEGLAKVRSLYYRSRELDAAATRARSLNGRSLRMAVADLTESQGSRYPGGHAYLARLDTLTKAIAKALPRAGDDDLTRWETTASLVADFDRLERESLLANPLLDFDRLLLVRRRPSCDARWPMDTGFGMGEYLGLPRQSSKHNPGIEEPFRWDNDIAVLQPVRPDGQLTTLYRPDRGRLITDVDLHWDADRLLFSMPGTLDKWQVFEMRTDGSAPRQLTPGDQPEVHSYDPCYLPNGRVAFLSTAPLQGVPCNAGVIVGMMYEMEGDGRNVRQVCFEQDHDYCPTVLNDGRVLYLRWDYTDTPHVWNRVLFSMNPDGTGQAEYYGSNSYWPNAIFYARPVPGHATKVAGIVTGHHVGRVGELVIFDPARGRTEADGVVQRVPGYGKKVEPLIQDKLTEHSWPKFLHPWPLSEKYFIVSCKPTPDALWGIYLVDVFDNMVLLKELEGQALLEPIPLEKRPRPPVIADKVSPARQDAVVMMADVYSGPGLAGVPRGTVKALRVFSYHFGYQQVAGIDHRVGTDGPWEVKRILGTVPVDADGSASFRIPARTPVSVQPLDAQGRAVQVMRSWMTAMPGEVLSCVGCHDRRDTSPPAGPRPLAFARRPDEIRPWHGPARNFSFRNEVQPVVDLYCVSCHDGRPRPDGSTTVDLRSDQGAYICFRGGDPRPHVERGVAREKLIGRYGGIFEPGYVALRSLVRVPGLESDLHLLPPMEFHAGATELVQMLEKGHHGVRLDAEAWDRLHTWIDLNAPDHGTWGEFVRISGDQRRRRRELQALYGGPVSDGDVLTETAPAAVEPVAPSEPPRPQLAAIGQPGWPFDAAEAARRQQVGGPAARTLDLGGGVTLDLVRIPAGAFVMGDADGQDDERPLTAVKVAKAFWIGRCEITNAQFARFAPTHQSRYEHRGSWIFSEDYLGWPLDRPSQPVVRVSWNEVTDFCRWLAQRSGLPIGLPTEAQWEYACRAGTATPFSHGGLSTDFSPFANLADVTIRDLAEKSWSPRTPDIVPRDARFNDHELVSAAVGRYRANAWGLHDMHGNVAEWTGTLYRPYPYSETDGRNAATGGAGSRVVRGGSWRDRPARSRSAARLAYVAHQKAFNVGFRVAFEETEPRLDVTARAARP